MTKKHLSIPIIIAALLIFFGISLRTVQYSSGRSLWLDEAMLALNIVNKSYVELTESLDYAQGAPLGFLFIVKSIVNIAGNKESTLRFFSFITGIASVFLFYRLSKRVISQKGGLIGLGLFSILTPLVYYASEVKPYASDVAIYLLLLLVTLRYLDNKSNKNLFILTVTGLIALVMSYPAIFMIAGVGVCLLINAAIEREGIKFRPLIFILFIWFSFFIALYYISYQSLAANQALVRPYASSFMPVPPWSDINWFHRSSIKLLENPIAISTHTVIKYLVMILIIAGCYSLFRKDRDAAILFIVPIICVLIASGLEKYPFEGRFVLFLVPFILFLLGEGIASIHLSVGKYSRTVATVLSVALVVLIAAEPMKNAVYNLFNPYMREHIKPVLAYISKNKSDTDNIYVYYAAQPAFKYYASKYGFRKNYIKGIKARYEPQNYIKDIDSLDKDRRVWFIFSHNCSWCKVNEKEFFLLYLDRIGSRKENIQAPGASGFLYDFGP